MPCRHYWIQVLCRVPEALGKGQIALGKAFAECDTRQRTHGKKLIGKALFVECLLSGTRQRLCRVPRRHSAKKSNRHGAGPVDGHFAECQPGRHSAKIFYFFFKISLPSANPSGTRQRVFIFFYKISLPSANLQALGKDFLSFIFLISLPSALYTTLGKV